MKGKGLTRNKGRGLSGRERRTPLSNGPINLTYEQEVDQPSEAICLAALALAIAIESGADTRNRKKGRFVALLFHA